MLFEAWAVRNEGELLLHCAPGAEKQVPCTRPHLFIDSLELETVGAALIITRL